MSTEQARWGNTERGGANVVVWFQWIIGAMAGIYVAINLGVLWGVRRTDRIRRRRPGDELPFVSVLVAARNEEENIVGCLCSLVAQDYPADRYEVVLVNDRSTDGTRALAETFSRNHPNVTLVDVAEEPIGLTGKQNALRVGYRYCRGEIILNTDADCVVPSTWVRAMVARFGEGVGLVMGVPMAHRAREDASLLARIQSIDLAYLLNQAIGTVGFGRPASCIGNNLAVRRKALEEVGGYDGMGYALTEDAELIRRIHHRTSWEIAAAQEPGTVVITQPARTWRQFYRQRTRWILGGLDASGSAIIALRFVHLFHLVLVSMPVIVWGMPGLWPVCLAAATCKAGADFAVAWQGTTRLGRKDALRVFAPYLVYQVVYTTLLGFTPFFARRIEWKGQVYRRRR